MFFSVWITANSGRNVWGASGVLTVFLIMSCKIETTVMDTVGLVPMPKLVWLRGKSSFQFSRVFSSQKWTYLWKGRNWAFIAFSRVLSSVSLRAYLLNIRVYSSSVVTRPFDWWWLDLNVMGVVDCLSVGPFLVACSFQHSSINIMAPTVGPFVQ